MTPQEYEEQDKAIRATRLRVASDALRAIGRMAHINGLGSADVITPHSQDGLAAALLSRAGNVAARAILRAALPSMPLPYLVRTLRDLNGTACARNCGRKAEVCDLCAPCEEGEYQNAAAGGPQQWTAEALRSPITVRLRGVTVGVK